MQMLGTLIILGLGMLLAVFVAVALEFHRRADPWDPPLRRDDF